MSRRSRNSSSRAEVLRAGAAAQRTQATPRRLLLRRLVLAAVAAAAAPGAAAAEEVKEGDKVTKAQAQYQDHPKGQQRCEICLQFMPPGQCRIVAGPISPKGWCQFFAARENAH
jgi:hypothetical protein